MKLVKKKQTFSYFLISTYLNYIAIKTNYSIFNTTSIYFNIKDKI